MRISSVAMDHTWCEFERPKKKEEEKALLIIEIHSVENLRLKFLHDVGRIS